MLSLLGDTITFLRGIALPDLLADAWQPRSGDYGLATIVSGTLVISVIAMVVATPLGLGAAIYLAEYASPRVRGWLKPVLEILATIPSVVLGFFALTVLSPALVQPLCGNSLPFTLASAGDRGGHPRHAAGRFDLRRRDVRGPCQPPRGLVRPRRDQAHDEPPGRGAGSRLGHRGLAHRGPVAAPSARP